MRSGAPSNKLFETGTFASAAVRFCATQSNCHSESSWKTLNLLLRAGSPDRLTCLQMSILNSMRRSVFLVRLHLGRRNWFNFANQLAPLCLFAAQDLLHLLDMRAQCCLKSRIIHRLFEVR